MTSEQKKNLLIGGGVGVLALLGGLLLGRRTAGASPRTLAGPPLVQVPVRHPPSQGQVPHRRKRRRHEGGERGDNGRGEYGRKKKHKRHHRDD